GAVCLQVLGRGHSRAQVLGVTAVLGTGEVVEVNPRGLTKDNTGYDLAGLLCGSEGTLGIVTEARLRLVPAHTDRAVALLAFTTAAEAGAALPVLRAVPAVSALEAMAAPGLGGGAAPRRTPTGPSPSLPSRRRQRRSPPSRCCGRSRPSRRSR